MTFTYLREDNLYIHVLFTVLKMTKGMIYLFLSLSNYCNEFMFITLRNYVHHLCKPYITIFVAAFFVIDNV